MLFYSRADSVYNIVRCRGSVKRWSRWWCVRHTSKQSFRASLPSFLRPASPTRFVFISFPSAFIYRLCRLPTQTVRLFLFYWIRFSSFQHFHSLVINVIRSDCVGLCASLLAVTSAVLYATRVYWLNHAAVAYCQDFTTGRGSNFCLSSRSGEHFWEHSGL